MSLHVDLNSDLGEGAGFDKEILELVTSASITCGFHAGDPASILKSIRAAQEHNVSIGAHPSFDDRENFGRTDLAMEPSEVFAQVAYQLGAFEMLATAATVRVNHVKPHGALYNMAARDEKLAEAIVSAILMVDPYLILFSPPNSALERAGKAAEVRVLSEVFADRNYLSDGSLVARDRPDALLTDPIEAAKRVLRMLQEGKVRAVDGHDVDVRAETICVHGDTPGAVEFVSNLRFELKEQGVVVSAPDVGL
ncbi:MAG: 5-oxoprolinase subunit PxpA [Spartobacteria bacterium]